MAAETPAIPTRLTTDANAAADINALQSQISEAKNGGADWVHVATPTNPASGRNRLYFKSDGKLYKLTSAGSESEIGATAGLDDIIFDFRAGDFYYPSANPAPLNTRTLTNGVFQEHLFDSSTEEFVLFQFVLPRTQVLTNYTTANFSAYVSAVTAAASKNVKMKFYHSAAAATEDIDIAFSSKESGNEAITNTQDALNNVGWSETIANLGWAGGDLVRCKLSRITTTSNLVGDLGLLSFRIRFS